LYEAGIKKKLQKLDGLEAWAMARAPITIVAIPGIFGEFIDRLPFEEVLKTESTFKREWRQLCRRLPARHRTTKVFSVKDLDYRSVPLEEVFEVGSIDGEEGMPLVRYIYLKPQFGSLETLGSLESKLSFYKE